MKVSVVIPVYNCVQTLGAQLDALLNQKGDIDYEVIVADNDSTDSTKELVLHYMQVNSRVKYIYAGERKGVCHARNVGSRMAIGEVLFYCDGDDVADQHWIEKLYEGIAKYDIWGGTLDMLKLNEHGYLLKNKPVSRTNPLFGSYPFIGGANFAIKKAVLEELGGWNEDYDFGGSDDIELSWRALLAQYQLGICEEAIMYYRLRNSYWSHFIQTIGYGIGNPKIVRDFKKYRMIKESELYEILNSLAFLFILGIQCYKGKIERVRFFRRLGFFIGMIYGSIKFRVFFIQIPA